MQPAAIVVLIAVILIALAIVAAVVKYLFNGKSPRSSGKTAKKVSLWRLIKALRADSAKLTKRIKIRSLKSSEDSDDKLEKGVYEVAGVAKNDKGEYLLMLLADDEDGNEKPFLVKFVSSIEFVKATKEAEDEDDEGEDD